MSESPADASHLEGLNPFDSQDAETARIADHLAELDDAGWAAPSRCDGWTVHDVVAHLAATEQYHHACFEGGVAAMIEQGLAAGMTSLEDFNQAGVDERADHTAAEVTSEFLAANEQTRRLFRERDGGQMDSSIGAYPVRWQAFHIADELATHADDISAPVDPGEAADRAAWRAAFSRFSLSERRPEAIIEVVADGTRVVVDGREVVVDDETLVEGVARRLGADADPDVVAALGPQG